MSWARVRENQDRVKYYMQKAAVAIIGEDASTEHHADRKTYSDAVLSGAASVYEMAVAVTTNSTVAAEITAGTVTDSSLEYTVNSLIDDMAGAE